VKKDRQTALEEENRRLHKPESSPAYSETSRRGGITKTGNSHAQRLCAENVWADRYPARITSLLLKRQEGLPGKILEIA